MEITKISLENFQCYAGHYADNSFEFSKGLNVVIGDNASGKSKIYDGFYWLLYDRVFDSQSRRFIESSNAGIGLVSDKAKYYAKAGEKISAKVKLYLIENREGENDQVEYTLERSYTIKRINNEASFDKDEAWEMPNSSISHIEKKDVLDFKPLNDADFDRISSKLLPNDMKPYLWFQGEQVDSLIDFRKEESLTEAINILSDINHYDYLIEVARKTFKQADTAYRSELSKNSRATKKAEEAQKNIERLEKSINSKESNLKKIEENLEEAISKREELVDRVDDAQKYQNLLANYKTEKENLKALKSTYDKAQRNYNSNLFRKKWLLLHGASFYDEFEKALKAYDEKRENKKLELKIEKQQKEANLNRLPENVPNKVYLNEMLYEKHCFLCDRDFEEGDHSYNHINQLLERAKKSRINYTDFLKNDLKKDLESLKTNGSYLRRNYIDSIKQSIHYELESLDRKKDEIINKQQKLEELEGEMASLLSSSKLDEKDADNIPLSFRSSNSSIDTLTERKNKMLRSLEMEKDELKNYNQELESYAGDDIDDTVKSKKEILEAFYEIAESTRNQVYEEQIQKIESEANKHYFKMTEDNQAIRGRIILKKTGRSYMPQNVDENGNILTSPNDANIILIKLATIMAIVTAKSQTTDVYPMISDAPTSKFGDNYTIGFCQALSEVFNQSIIFSYDFYQNKELRERLMNDIDRLGNVYIITPSIKEEERMNRIELSTNINKIN